MNNNLEEQSNLINEGMQQNQFNNYNNGVNKKNNKTILIIIGLIIVLISILLFYLKFRSSEDYSNYEEELKEYEKEVSKINKNYKVSSYNIVDGILVELKNNNNVVVDADITINFYNENGSIIDSEQTTIDSIPKNDIGYTFLYLFDEDFEYETYKVEVKLDKSYNQQTYNNYVDVTYDKLYDGNYTIHATNKYNEMIFYAFVGIFYMDKNDKIVAFEDVMFSNLISGYTSFEKVYTPDKEGYYDNPIDYDYVKVKVLNTYVD